MHPKCYLSDVGLKHNDNSESQDTATTLDTAGTNEEHGTTNTIGQVKSMFVAPYNFEGFAKTAAESTKLFPAPVEEAKPLLVAAAA